MDTLHESAQAIHNGELQLVVSRMRKKTAMLEDAPVYEATDRTSHTFTYDTSLPTGSWRAYNEGVAKETWTAGQGRADIGLLQSRSQVDYNLMKIQPNPDQYRSNMDLRFAEGLGQTLATGILYGRQAITPNSFNGIMWHYPLLATEGVYNMGGTATENGTLTDILLIDWGPQKAYMVYPNGSGAMGYERLVFPLDTLTDQNDATKKFPGYESFFGFNLGLVIENPRSVKRITNVSVDPAAADGVFDEDLLIEALEDMEDEGAGATIYMCRKLRTRLSIAAKDTSNAALGWSDIFGHRVMTFWDRPVRTDEMITYANNVVA